MRRLAATALAVPLACGAAHAQESPQDKDLALIPGAAPAAAPLAAPATDGARSIYLENALTNAGRRGDLIVPPPGGPPAPWIERLFLDARTSERLAPGLTLNLSARANARAQDGIVFPSREAFRLDVRELYLSWSPAEGRYLDIGRINLKSGVALGYNPTDVFRTRAVVEVLSADPSTLREDRLGAVMVRGQVVTARLSATLAYAPRLYRPSAIYGNLALPALDPMLDRTNAADRILLKVNAKVGSDISPEALVYVEDGHTRFGLNVTESVGRNVVLYAEWAGGRQEGLIAEALDYGRRTASIPRAAPDPLPVDRTQRFRNDLSAGASYTTASKIVFNLEYHFHEAGFSDTDWDRWFAAGPAARADPRLAGELWYIRAYAADQQAPLSRHTAFLRADRQDAFTRNLELSGFVSLDLQDGSGATQLSADYFLSDHLTFGALAIASFGARRTDFGSSPGAASVLFKLVRYF